MAENQDLMCDIGSALTKCGIIGDVAPRSVFPTVVGRARTQRLIHDRLDIRAYFGDDARAECGNLRLSHPMRRGVVMNWPEMADFYCHMLQRELRVDPTTSRVLLTEPVMSQHENRERTAAVMFETVGVRELFIANQGELSLLATGRTTGCALECGDGSTQVVPIYGGRLQRHAVMRVDMAGDDLTRFMQRLLMEVGPPLNTTAEYDIVRSIKEQFCRVALNFEAEKNAFVPSPRDDFELPDGSVLHVGNRCLQCPEALFQPGLIGRDLPGIHELIRESVERCEIHLRRDLMNTVVISGG